MASFEGSIRGHKLRRVPNAAGPDYVRSLVDSSSSQRRLEAPATAVVVSASADLGTTTTASCTDTQRGTWNVHLAQLLHSMYLVTLVEKAQLGAMHVQGDSAKSTSAGATAGLPHASQTPKCVHSVSVDERWLDAVTRYCHFTFSVDDVARVAMVFPDLLRVRWTLEQLLRTPDLTTRDAFPAEASLPTPSRKKHRLEGGGGAPLDGPAGNDSSTARGGKLVGRVYLLQPRVVSVEEAERHLQEALQRKGSAAAQRAWKALVNHHSAYAAYLDRLEETRSVTTSAAQAEANDVANNGKRSTPTRHGGDSASGAHKESAASALPFADDEELLQQISAELRASLSAAKLQDLLQQMRQDTARVEEQEQQRIAQRQLQERLVNTYEHVRALHGPKEKHGRSAAALINALRQESRFDDVLDIKALLSALLEIPASGLSATRLVDTRIVAEPAPLPTPAATGVGTRSRRKKAAEETETPSTAVVMRLTEPSVQAVTDLRGLTDEELEVVLVRFDRTKGSVRGVLDATTHCEAR